MLTPDTLLQNRYMVLRQIGRGGMGAVYLARDQRLNNMVAIKETLTTSDHLRKAFEREAQLLANLRHPALPVVSDHFIEGDGQFLVMQYIPGNDLQEMVSQKGSYFSCDKVLQWADQLLDALEYLHSQRPPVIHRDIKPQNLKLTERNQIILLDFGLAKGSIDEATHAEGGKSIQGYTPNYAPIEQVQGSGTDARSDLYSLGATLYYLLTAVIPPDAVTRVVAAAEGRPDFLFRADRLNPQVPSNVADVLQAMLAVRRDQRPARADDVRRALRAAVSSPLPVPVTDRRSNEFSDTLIGPPTGPQMSDPTLLLPTPGTIAVTESATMASTGDASTNPFVRKSTGSIWLIGGVLVAALVVALVWMLSSRKTDSLKSFQFETVSIDYAANVTDRRGGQSPYYSEVLSEGVSLDMVEIKGGTFLMGSPGNEESRSESEGPQHQVAIPSFFIAKSEVTQAQWRAVASSLPKVNRDLITEPSFFKGDDKPVEQVTWEDAIEFCSRLSAITGKPYRLPTEAEWEYACRGGATTPFSFGENITTDIVNYNGEGPYRTAQKSLYRDQTTAAGSLGAANAFGLFDMHGNVFEWCSDIWHEDYTSAPSDGSSWETSGDESLRVVRGGSWYVQASFCRAARRYKIEPDTRDFNVGFRVVVSQPKPAK
jgi:formylglycine-generating enzyme required for sulfatase activity